MFRLSFSPSMLSSSTPSDSSFESLYLSDASGEDPFRVPILGPMRPSIASRASTEDLRSPAIPSSTPPLASSTPPLASPSHSHPSSPVANWATRGVQTITTEPFEAGDRRTTLDMLDCALNELSIASPSVTKVPSPQPPSPEMSPKPQASETSPAPAATAAPQPLTSDQLLSSALHPILSNRTLFSSNQQIASITVSFVTSDSDRDRPEPHTPSGPPRQSFRSPAAPPHSSDSDDSPPRPISAITRRKHIKKPSVTPTPPSTPAPHIPAAPTPTPSIPRSKFKPARNPVPPRFLPPSSPASSSVSPRDLALSRAPLFLSAVGGYDGNDSLFTTPPPITLPLSTPHPVMSQGPDTRHRYRVAIGSPMSSSSSSVAPPSSASSSPLAMPIPRASRRQTSLAAASPSSYEATASAVGVPPLLSPFRTPSPVPVQWIMGPGGTIHAPNQLRRLNTFEYWVVSWGRTPGVYYTSMVAAVQSGDSPFVIAQTFRSPRAAMLAWSEVYHERRYCHLRPWLPLPPRDVCEVVYPVVESQYQYLSPRDVPASAGYCVIIRGLATGVFSSWLVAGPFVVGIKCALYRRCETKVEADLVWKAALADGLVQSVTLVTPMAPVYLDLSCDYR